MGIASEGLDLWKRDQRRKAVGWFRSHGAAAAATVGAQWAGRRTWEGAYRAGSAATAAMKESVTVLRNRHVHDTEEIPDGRGAMNSARSAASTDSPAGQQLGLAAAVLIAEADAAEGATETVETLAGLKAGAAAYAEAVAYLAETVRNRKGDRKAVKALNEMSDVVTDLADEANRVHRLVDALYSPQQEQEESTGEAMK